MFRIDKRDVTGYIEYHISIAQECSDNLIVFTADGGNHFTKYGIFEGMLLFFDLEKDFKNGWLSCFSKKGENDRLQYKVSDKPLPGYSHLGRLVMSMRNYEV